MNWETPKVGQVSAQVAKQEQYGSRRTLLFGLTMISFFIVTYMSLNNFAFRAMCVRYLMSPLPSLIIFVGYFFCFVFLVLAFYAFFIFFKIAPPIESGLDLKDIKLLGLNVSSKQGKSAVSESEQVSKPSILPLPAWATQTDVHPSNKPSSDTSSSIWSSSRSSSTKNGDKSPSKQQSPNRSSQLSPKVKRSSQSYRETVSSPKSSVSWITREKSPMSPPRLSSPILYPTRSALSGSGGSLPSGGSPLSPTSYGQFNTKMTFPGGSSPMLHPHASRASQGSTSIPSSPFYMSTTPMRPSHSAQIESNAQSPLLDDQMMVYGISSPPPHRTQNTPEITSLFYNSPLYRPQDTIPSARSTSAYLSNQQPMSSMSGASSNIYPSHQYSHGDFKTPGNIQQTPGFQSPSQQSSTTTTRTPSSSFMTSPRAQSSSPFSIDPYSTSSMSPLNRTSASIDGKSRATSNQISYLNSPNTDFSFSDPAQLHEFVEQQKRIQTTRDYLYPSSSNTTGGIMSGASPMHQPAYRSNIKLPAYLSMSPAISSDKSSTKGDGSFADDNQAMILYSKQGVASHMEQWTENLREWLNRRVLKPVVDWMDSVEQRMGKDALYQAQFSQVQSGVHSLQNQQAKMFAIKPTIGGTTSTADQQQQQFLEERMKLERYFGDFGSSREYVVERIRTLSRGTVIPDYNWNSGGRYKDKEWTTDLPTDSQIICHLFCSQLDQWIVATDSAHIHDAFRSKYFVSKEEKVKPNFAIIQKSFNPPHYNIMVDHQEWTIRRGRNNLFEAILMFIFVVRKLYKGYLNQRYLGGEIGLLDLLSD